MMPKAYTCKFCKEPIRWQEANERWIPFNVDGTAHRCAPGQKDKSKPKAEPVRGINNWDKLFNYLDSMCTYLIDIGNQLKRIEDKL